MATRIGALSPPVPRSATSSPRTKFPADSLRPYMRQLLGKTLADKARMSAYSKEISERVKQRMIELEPRGFKYIVTSTFSENLGQAGRADMSCHWEDTDGAIQEIYSNDSLIFVIIAYAVRVG